MPHARPRGADCRSANASNKSATRVSYFFIDPAAEYAGTRATGRPATEATRRSSSTSSTNMCPARMKSAARPVREPPSARPPTSRRSALATRRRSAVGCSILRASNSFQLHPYGYGSSGFLRPLCLIPVRHQSPRASDANCAPGCLKDTGGEIGGDLTPGPWRRRKSRKLRRSTATFTPSHFRRWLCGIYDCVVLTIPCKELVNFIEAEFTVADRAFSTPPLARARACYDL
mmetsp:Transcript_10497/g.31647  ORF Transcript_10497/g.31647 Transcript_10497/m.31647 type:complete len:231 (-) Transcript_10497:1837-2529(-)